MELEIEKYTYCKQVNLNKSDFGGNLFFEINFRGCNFDILLMIFFRSSEIFIV